MSQDLIIQAYEQGQIKGSDAEKGLVDQTKKNINNRYKDYQRIMKDMSDGYAKNNKEEKKKPLKQLDPDKMSPMQLLSEGFRQLEEEKKEAEKETTKTINLNEEDI